MIAAIWLPAKLVKQLPHCFQQLLAFVLVHHHSIYMASFQPVPVPVAVPECPLQYEMGCTYIASITMLLPGHKHL